MADGHAMASSVLVPSIWERVHVPSLHWSSPPEPSTAAQNVAVGHETPVRATPLLVVDAGPGSTRTLADHAWPFHWKASPAWSTAVQKEADGQETPEKLDVLVYGSGVVHWSPFHSEIPPDTEMQNDAETQEMDETEPQAPLVPRHACPSKANAFPSESTDAQYPVGAQPTASRSLAPPTVTGGDQACPSQSVIWFLAVATAMQRDGLAHDTESAPSPSACAEAGTGPDHSVPSKE